MIMSASPGMVTVSAGQHAHDPGAGWIGWAIVAFVVAAAIVGEAWLMLVSSSRSDRGDDSDDGGGGGVRRIEAGDGPKGPRPPESDSEPDWWPQFEREFAAHTARRPARSK
jgi:hypothetical protein